jgi:hypothetical protein
MIQSKESMLKILLECGAAATSPSSDGADYSRVIEVKALFSDIKIVWWSNVAYVFISGSQVVFDTLDVSGTWPNEFKLSINFRYNNKAVCIVPLTK